MAEVLSMLAIATKEMKQRRTSESISGRRASPHLNSEQKHSLRNLFGRNDIEDALRRLDKLEQGELRTVTAQVLKTTSDLKDGA
jgi:ribosomal protein S21